MRAIDSLLLAHFAPKDQGQNLKDYSYILLDRWGVSAHQWRSRVVVMEAFVPSLDQADLCRPKDGIVQVVSTCTVSLVPLPHPGTGNGRLIDRTPIRALVYALSYATERDRRGRREDL